MAERLGRRDFLKGMALSAVGVAGAGALVGCTTDGPQTGTAAGGFPFSDTIGWNGQYDVVVIGFGGAGAVAAKAAAEEGATVLLLEKGPQGAEGGNTKYSAQCTAYGRGDIEATRRYYTALYNDKPVSEDVFNVYTEGVAHSQELLADFYGLDQSDFVISTPDSAISGISFCSPEYPEFPGSDKVGLFAIHGGMNDGALWQVQRKSIVALKDKVDVWFESPAVKLIQDPQSKTILGVTVERAGEAINIRAANGVILTCGGFENNEDMVKDYTGLGGGYRPLGTLYNTGDGVRMGLEIGADLQHMHSYESMPCFGGTSWLVPKGTQGRVVTAFSLIYGASVFVGTDGYRYLREDELARHGHVFNNGVWDLPRHPERCFVIWDSQQNQMVANAGPLGIPEAFVSGVIEAASIAEIAERIGAKPEVLERTIANFNQAATTGNDPAFNRSAQSMRAFGAGPYYAIELAPAMLNTQGGPKRNAEAEVLDTEGNPIPHLYSAGECGGVTSNMYNGGGNLAENLIFGRIAGKNAAAEKDELPDFALSAVASSIVYTLGTQNDLNTAVTYETANNEYIGTGTGIGGDIVVKVTTADGSRIDAVEVLAETETPDIGGAALRQLPQMVLDAQSTDIDAISGATVTTDAFLAAVKEAMSQA
jgi:succinate dehydrogenase/fumarate reductase flavoprotein subunit